jgi:hypothetical protein
MTGIEPAYSAWEVDSPQPWPIQPCLRPATYLSDIRKGGTFLGDGTLGTR